MVVEDAADADSGSGTNTPAGEPDDFFSSWDKPSVKRPSNPPSRTGTPGITRTASPFLGANGNGPPARTKSPLTAAEPTPPTASRTTSTAALRKTTTSSKPKSNILGAKKSKLGAKKVDASLLDFDEAEKKAREEAERKERLGYDPDEDTPPAPAPIKAALPEPAAPTMFDSPSSGLPPRPKGDYGSGSQRARDEEMERLNTSTRKLGFGQIGGGAKTAAPKAKTMGFGSTTRAPVEGKRIKLTTLGTRDRSLTMSPQTTPNATPAKSSASKKASPPTSSSAKAPMTRPHKTRPRPACKASKALSPSLPTPTSAVPKTRRAPVASRTMAIWRLRQRTLCASSASPLAMIWRTCRACLARARRSCRVLLGII